jgi:hypothetical protein
MVHEILQALIVELERSQVECSENDSCGSRKNVDRFALRLLEFDVST